MAKTKAHTFYWLQNSIFYRYFVEYCRYIYLIRTQISLVGINLNQTLLLHNSFCLLFSISFCKSLSFSFFFSYHFPRTNCCWKTITDRLHHVHNGLRCLPLWPNCRLQMIKFSFSKWHFYILVVTHTHAYTVAVSLLLIFGSFCCGNSTFF